MNIQNRYSDNIIGYTLAGLRIDPVRVDPTNNAPLGHTLTAGTYYFPLDVTEETLIHVTMKWGATFAAAITLESSDFPEFQSNQVPDVTAFSVAAGDWEPENPTGANSSASGSGNTATALVFAAGGTAAGGAQFHYASMGTKRLRLKVVCSTGGLLRIANNAKRTSAT